MISKTIKLYLGQTPNKINRSAWWLSRVVVIILAFVFIGVIVNMESIINSSVLSGLILILGLIFILYISINMNAKRLRDIGISPWYLIFSFIPGAELFFITICGFVPKDKFK